MRRSIDEDGCNVKRLQLDREVMIQVDNSAAEAEVTGRQPDVDAIRQEFEAVLLWQARRSCMQRRNPGQAADETALSTAVLTITRNNCENMFVQVTHMWQARAKTSYK